MLLFKQVVLHKRIKFKHALNSNGEQNSTSLSASAIDRNKTSENIENEENYGFKYFLFRICSKICMDTEAEESEESR